MHNNNKINKYIYKIEAKTTPATSENMLELPQASECLMSAPDFWPDTSAGYGA